MPRRLVVSRSKSNSITTGGLVFNYPAVVPRFDRQHSGRSKLLDAAIPVFDVNLTLGEKANVRVHANEKAVRHSYRLRGRSVNTPPAKAVPSSANDEGSGTAAGSCVAVIVIRDTPGRVGATVIERRSK